MSKQEIVLDISDDVCSNLINNLPGLFYRCLNDADWTMIFASNGCKELTGYSNNEILQNKSISYGALIHPNDQQWLIEKCTYNLERKIPCNNEYRIVCRQGKTKWVQEVANGIYDNDGHLIYIEGYIQDITTQKDNFVLSNSFSSYQNAINKGSIVSITDPNGNIIFANELFCDYSKYSRKELIGQNHRIVNSDHHSKEFFSFLWRTIKDGKIWRGEVKNKAKDGTFYWVDTVVTPVFNERKEIIQYLSIRNIITEKKEIEEALVTKKNELRKAIDDVTSHFNDMMQFNYIVSHNLRAPVANILGLSDMIINNVNSDEDKLRIIEYIKDSTVKLDSTLKDLHLILSSKSNVDSKREKVSVTELINNIKVSLITQINDSGAVIETVIAKEADDLFTIKSYLESILFNLISNALKYRSPKRKLKLIITAVKSTNSILLTIKDNGLGIDLISHGEQVFGLYKRFHSEIEGKGLGLHMSKTQVETLGGNITIESEVDDGTSFTISLPTN